MPLTVSDIARMPSGASVMSMAWTRLRKPAFWMPSVVASAHGRSAARLPVAVILAPLRHEGPSCLDGRHQARDRDPDIGQQLVNRQRQDVLHPRHAGVEVQMLDRARVLAESLDRSRQSRGVGEIGSRPAGGETFGLQLATELGDLIFGPRDQGWIEARLPEPTRDRRPNARTCAEDDDDRVGHVRTLVNPLRVGRAGRRASRLEDRAACRTRTDDLPLTRRLLYQLSQRGMGSS